eukprot:11552661-Prorocentrum_lima.AAC.1
MSCMTCKRSISGIVGSRRFCMIERRSPGDASGKRWSKRALRRPLRSVEAGDKARESTSCERND